MSITATTPGGSPQQLNGQISYDRILTAPLAVSQNDYNPRGLVNTSGIYLRAPVPSTITGIEGGKPARRLTLVNTGDQTITLTDDDPASAAANRFLFGADVNLLGDQLIDLEWSPAANRWLPVAAPGAGGGIPGDFTDIIISGSIIESGILTPDQITADEDDYAPIGISQSSTLRLSADAPHAITGFAMDDASDNDGRVLRIINVGAQDITMAHEGAASAAENRLRCPGSVDFTVVGNGSCTVWYDTDSTRWRVLP